MLQKNFYNSIKSQFLQLTDEQTFIREVNFAIQILKDKPYLQKCDADSVLKAVFEISQTGLTLNPVFNYAYLIPRKGKCYLEPGYQGLIKLATDTDNINSIEVQLVYEGCECEIDLATEKKIVKHIPYQATGKDKGNILFGYSKAILQDGRAHVEIMSYKDILDIRGYSESYKDYVKKKSKGEWATSTWVDNESEMCRKTIVRRHFKYLPKSDNKQLQRAIELDNADYDFPASFEQGNIIESLLLSCAIPIEREREIHQRLHAGDFTQKQAAECIKYLEDHQQNPIDAGKTYNAGDIQKTLRERI